MNMAKKKATKTTAWSPKESIVFMDVDNPLYSRAHHASRGNPVKIKAAVNVRESPIGLLAARGIINIAQVRAATRFRSLWEMLGTSVKAMDYSIDPVDGGGLSDPISLRQMDAGLQLKSCRELLGARHYDVLSKVVGQGTEISALGKTRRERDTYADYIKHGLEDLAIFWGYQTNNQHVNNRKVNY